MASEPRAVWGDLPASAFVEASPLFRSLDQDAREDLLRVAELLVYQAGEVVVRQGEPGDDLFLVREGSAAVSVETGGAAREVAFLDRGAIFGEFAAVGGSAVRLATVSARTELSVIRFPGAVVVALAGRFPKVGKLLDALQAARQRGGAPA
jgi:CRP-like cAMP-binding protein